MKSELRDSNPNSLKDERKGINKCLEEYRTCIGGQVPSDNPAPFLEAIQAIGDTRERGTNNRHIQIGEKKPY